MAISRVCVALVALLPITTAYNNGAPHSRLPPLGWSSWVALGPDWPGPDAKHPVFDFCDEASVKLSMDAFVDLGFYESGYRHFHLDDCWVDKERNATGFLQPNRQHFPNGMKPIVDYAHDLGLVFGLYTCAGARTCVGGLPGSKGHFEQDAQVFAEWGVDVMKMDWCDTKGMDPQTTYSQMSAALNRTGRRMHLNMCEWGINEPWKWGPAVAQSWRATYDHTGIWSSTKTTIEKRSQIEPEFGGGPYAWNDMDMLQTGNYKQAAHANGKLSNMSATEYRTEFAMWAVLASPLIVTTPLLDCSSGTCQPHITPLQREILFNKEVLAINQDSTPAGRVLDKSNGTQVFGRQLSDGSIAVVVYNPEDVIAEAVLNFSVLSPIMNVSSEDSLRFRDLWEQEDVGVAKGRYPEQGTMTVEAHATKVFRLTRADGARSSLLFL